MSGYYLKHKPKMIYLIYFLLILFCGYAIASPSDFLIVQTSNGLVRGQESVTENNKTTYLFTGIPYAEPPIGNLRFRTSVPKENWTGIYNATEFGNMCLQSAFLNETIGGDEDCLYLNVFTTQLPNNSNNSLLPVVVWIHGGGFVTGSGDIGFHGADRFLEHGVLLVSINYRLGLFGFLCTLDNVIPGNYGLKDQLLALNWVQTNIAAFGGNPNKVTIFGESAGAASVHYLRQAKRATGLFHGVIADSGNTLSPWSVSRNPRDLAFRIGLLNGVWTADSKVLIEGLRKVNGLNLQKSVLVPSLLDLFDPLNGLPFSPCMEDPSDEAVFTKDSYEAQENGCFQQTPLLHGFNSLEGREVTKLPWYGILLLSQYDLFPSRLTPLDMNASNNGNRIVGQHIKSYYFHNKSVSEEPGTSNYVTDNEFLRGIIKSSVLESRYSNVFLYRFSYIGGVEHTYFNPEGVSHAEELQYLFLSSDTIQTTFSAQLTTERMVEMWTNFIKTGNPTSTLTAAVNVSWPLVNATGFNNDLYYINIGDQLEIRINPEQHQMKFWENQYDVYGYPPYNTY